MIEYRMAIQYFNLSAIHFLLQVSGVQTWWWWSVRYSSCSRSTCSTDTDIAPHPHTSACRHGQQSIVP